ncbi:hypothetical protein GQ600_15838 [Phytophthora cactorum]|nr:hypothetical protein GQ600_15838 [Phytophthora cactorum]
MSEFNLSRNSIKKVWCIRGKVDVISAPARVQPKRGRRLTLNEVVQLQRQTQRSTQLRWQTLDQCFVTLQKVMESIMISGGVNDFKLPCVSKHVAVNGRMPMSVAVATDAVNNAMARTGHGQWRRQCVAQGPYAISRRFPCFCTQTSCHPQAVTEQAERLRAAQKAHGECASVFVAFIHLSAL